MFKNSIYPYLILSLFLFSLIGSACNSTKNASIPPANFSLESEKGWTWINRPAVEEGGKAYNLFFEAENRYTIYLDVNSCFGEYKKGEGQSLSLPEYAACTEMCCDKDISREFLNTLHKTETYAIHGDTLILKGTDKALRFLPAKGERGGE